MSHLTATTLAFAIVLSARAARAEESGGFDDLVEGRTYSTDELFPAAAESDVRLEARSTVDTADGATLLVDVTIINARDKRRRVELDNGCWDVRVRLYSSAQRTSPPAWDSASSDWSRAREGVVCAGTGLMLLMKPKASASPPNLHAKMTLSELRKGSLSEGTYHVTAEVKLDHPNVVMEIPAGSVVLLRQ